MTMRPFTSNSIVRLGPVGNGGGDFAYLKVRVGTERDRANFEAEVANREKVRDSLQGSRNRLIMVPRSYGHLRRGNTFYWLESAAQGTQVCRIVRQPGYFKDTAQVQNDFSCLVDRLIDLTWALQEISGARRTDPKWHTIPEEFEEGEQLRWALKEAGLSLESPRPGGMWVQHGDLSVENVFMDRETGRLQVFDWVDLAADLPPLYDLFQLFLSTAYLTTAHESANFSSEIEMWTASFDTLFFRSTAIGSLAEKLLIRACARLKLDPKLIPYFLLRFLITRTHYYRRKSIVQHEVHLRLLEHCLKRNFCVFGSSLLSPAVDAESEFTSAIPLDQPA